jgi:effector-binding domain-containing protein
MKAVLKLLYILLFLVIAILLVGLFLPRNLNIESSCAIDASGDIVFDQVNSLKNWENWSPWFLADTSIHITYNDVASAEGAESRWKNTQSNVGYLKILRSHADTSLNMQISFGEESEALMFWKFENEEKHIKVTWTFRNEEMTYFERYFMALYKKTIQNDMDQGLKNLKSVCEGLRLSRISSIEIVHHEKQPAMIVIDSASMKDMDSKIQESFKKLSAYLDKREIAIEGKKFVIYFTRDPNSVSKFACGFPIALKTWGWKEYSYFELPEVDAATVTHWGRYDSEKPYLALDEFVKDHNLSRKNMVWEVYEKSGEEESDTSLWVKQIFYPLEP